MKRLAPLFALLLAACATGPRFETKNVDTTLQPVEAAAQIDAVKGSRVLWGGVVLASRNLEESTQLEVLGYPLGEHNQKPNTDGRPLGRFLVMKSGYLETADYGPGRVITVIGRLEGTKSGKVGEAKYVYPVVEAGKIYLWPQQSNTSGPYFHFGVGVIFGN